MSHRYLESKSVGGEKVIIDLAGVESISVDYLAALIRLQAKLKNRGGCLVLANVGPLLDAKVFWGLSSTPFTVQRNP